MNISPETFVVLGSNCFTGSHIIDRILRRPGVEVLGLSRSPQKSSLFLPYTKRNLAQFTFQQIDFVREPTRLLEILDRFQPNFIINVAALSEVFQSHLTPNEYFAVNTSAVVHLVNELRNRTWMKRYIHVSSAEIYGNCTTAAQESDPLKPSTPYAVSKAAADMYLSTLHRHFGFPVSIVRSTNVYGSGQQLYKIIPRAMIRLKLGRPIELHGGGKAIRPFIHITDVVDGIMKIIEHPSPSLVYHFSTPDNACIREIVERICRQAGKDFNSVTQVAGDRAAQDSRYWLDTSLANRELNWRPQVSLDDGLAEVLHWIEENWESILREPLHYIHMVEYAPSRATSQRALPEVLLS